jgi:hypothetical protein
MQFEDIMKLVLGGRKKKGEEGDTNAQSADAPEQKQTRKGSWRHHLDSGLHSELNKLVHHTHKHRHAYKRTLKVRDAQLWVALAQMSQRLSRLEQQAGIQVAEPTEAIEKVETPAPVEAEVQKPVEVKITPEPITQTPTPEPLTTQAPLVQSIQPENNNQMLISGQISSSAQSRALPAQAE